MAEVKPFRGIRYNIEKVGCLEKVVTPPYDVIDSEAQERYYSRYPYNIIRLELGKTNPSDTQEENQYTRAKAYFMNWMENGILLRDKKPSIYLYEQEFACKGKQTVRKGVICTVKLEEYDKNIILPHEETLPKAKLDRLNLMRHCHANFSPIFGLYIDEENREEKLFKAIKSSFQPHINFIDENGHAHRVWVVQDQDLIRQWQSLLSDKRIFIADGHHRYETALEFSKEMRSKGYPGYDHVMMTLVNIYDSGLVIFPTHRLVHNIKNFEASHFIRILKDSFDTESLEFLELQEKGKNLPEAADKIANFLAKECEANHRFGVYTGGKNVYLVNIPKNREHLVDSNKSPAWNSLDIAILQKLIIEEILGIGDKERAEGNYLMYTRDGVEALAGVQKGDFQVAFLVNPTKVSEVVAVASAGDKMPQKSTYFYPKLITGLVINPLGE